MTPSFPCSRRPPDFIHCFSVIIRKCFCQLCATPLYNVRNGIFRTEEGVKWAWCISYELSLRVFESIRIFIFLPIFLLCVQVQLHVTSLLTVPTNTTSAPSFVHQSYFYLKKRRRLNEESYLHSDFICYNLPFAYPDKILDSSLCSPSLSCAHWDSSQYRPVNLF